MSARKTRPVFKLLGIGLIFLFVLMLFSEKKKPEDSLKGQPDEKPHASVPDISRVPRIKPETLVTFPDSTIACLSREALGAVSVHILKGEKTKAAAYMLSKEHPDGQCLMLDSKQKFKVLSVEYNSTDTPDIGIMEIVGTTSAATDGAWVFTLGAVAQQ